MPRTVLAAVLAALAAAAPASAQEAQAPATGLAATLSFGGGGELALDEGDDEGGAGVGEIELTLGYELESIGLRPEIGLVLGLSPDTHVALRPGLRWSLRTLPLQVRLALDGANARDRSMQWRWLLLGVATELRFTSAFGLFAEVDGGAPLSSEAGVPLLARAGATFRF